MCDVDDDLVSIYQKENDTQDSWTWENSPLKVKFEVEVSSDNSDDLGLVYSVSRRACWMVWRCILGKNLAQCFFFFKKRRLYYS
jgi:hypothetical protein